MHIISRKRLREFSETHLDFKDAAEVLDAWYRVAKAAKWKDFSELKAVYSRTADKVGFYVVFNIGGNKYRLVAEIFFENQTLLVRGVYTHREYDKLDLKG